MAYIGGDEDRDDSEERPDRIESRDIGEEARPHHAPLNKFGNGDACGYHKEHHCKENSHRRGVPQRICNHSPQSTNKPHFLKNFLLILQLSPFPILAPHIQGKSLCNINTTPSSPN